MRGRLLPGLLIGIVLLSLLLIGGYTFHFFAFILAGVAYYELNKMYGREQMFSLPFYSGLIIIAIIFYRSIAHIPIDNSFLIILYGVILLFYMLYTKNKFSFENAGFLMLGFVYITFGFLLFSETRMEQGFGYVLLIVISIWGTDTGAYYVGKRIGKTKLFEVISPNKTIEGAIGGIVVSIIIGVVFFSFTDYFQSIYSVLYISLIVSIFGQIGDLIESALKRQCNIKDSGNILGGHGGVLDRFDSTILVFLTLYIIENLLK